jgi:AraC family transcriptional regulator, transcriptional activator FtrA
MPISVKILPMPKDHRVVALAYDGLSPFEFGIVVEVFALRRPELKLPFWYRFSVCSLEPGSLRALGGVTVQAPGGLSVLRRADTIVVPGWRDANEAPPAALLSALRSAHRRGARIISICSGVFVLAAAGLLNGKRATTHWRDAGKLAARYPEIRVEPDVLFVDEGRILTSAGSAAGIDLCLHIVRKDFGAEIANQVAKRLVVSPQRDGDQSQYVVASLQVKDGQSLSRLLEWVQSHLKRDLKVDVLAKRAGMSARTFARRFRAEVGSTPYVWLTRQRLIAAQRILEMTDQSVDQVAETVGMNTAATLRHHFRNAFKTTPTAYRKRFEHRSV